MNTKKCSKCGWIYPADWPGQTCKFCHTPMEGGRCSGCGRIVEKLYRGHCKDCKTKIHAAWRAKKRAEGKDNYSDWLERIKAIPTPYKTLTEEQWNKACRHFNGCAYCGEPEISARSMFIDFKEGGRYCSWNIIPACEKCETAIVRQPNPFIRMDTQINRSADSSTRVYGLNKENLQRIVDYLEGEMK